MIWLVSGALTGLLMALWEYFFLATTVDGFGSGTELLVLASGLVSGMVLSSALLGYLVFLGTLPFRYLCRRFAERRPEAACSVERFLASRILLISLTSVGWIGVGLGFLLNALLYHRLYAAYHGALSGLTFLSGLAGSLAFTSLMRRKVEQTAVFRLRATFVGLSIATVAGALLLTPRLLTNENLKAIVADRGVTSAQVFMVLRDLFDRDGDGFARPPFGYDCDDSDPRRHPMRYDTPADGIDQDCTGADRRSPQPLPSPPPGTATGPKRILIFTIEALRADRWPGYTHRQLLPNVYKLSRLGFAFHRAYATSNWTIPSIYSLMTGTYPSHVRFVKAMMDKSDKVALVDPESPFAKDKRNMRSLIPVPASDRTPTLAQELRRRGYRTATVQDIPFLKRQMGMARGFDIVDDTPYRMTNRSLRGVTSPSLARQALKILRAHREEKLFLYVHFGDPHAPYHRHVTPTDLGSSAEDRYDSEIRFVDGWIGFILGNLQKEGLLKDTLIVITADHGQEFYDHGGQYHATTVYEELIRVPLVFVGEGIHQHVTMYPVSLVDVFPTVLSLVDGTQDRHLAAGVDLSRWLRTRVMPQKLSHRPIYAESRRFQNWKQALITNRYKLILDNKVGTSQLFDLHRDRGEKHNLIGQAPHIARELLKDMYLLLDQ